jgi:hypothetical protein
MVILSAIISDDEDDIFHRSRIIIQGHLRFLLMDHSRQRAFCNRRRNFLLIRQNQAAAASLLQRQWLSKLSRKRSCALKKALVALQARARRKYFWGVNDEDHEIILKVLEFRKVIASMRHALSIVCYFQFLVDNAECLNMVFSYKKILN